MTTATTIQTTPHLFRCHLCLEVYASDTRYLDQTTCVCGGGLRYQGQVNKGRVIYTADAPPCNYLCGDALGKSCVCQCGGVNHGCHRMITIRRDAGAAPEIVNPEADACRARAEEIMAARRAIWAMIEDRFGDDIRELFNSGTWINNRVAFDACVLARSEINAAMGLNSHKGRLARLNRPAAAAAYIFSPETAFPQKA